MKLYNTNRKSAMKWFVWTQGILKTTGKKNSKETAHD